MSATTPESIRELAAGYALGALTPEETRDFEAALAQSADLQSEVAEYREVNALLAGSRAEQPAAALKDRLMARIHEAKNVSLVQPAARRFPWLAMALAATGLVAVGLGARIRWLERQLTERNTVLAATAARLARREETLNTLLNAESDLTVVQLSTAGVQAPGMQLFWNRRANRAVLYAFRLPPAAAGRVYQLWLIPRGGTPIPSATFNSEPDGHALVEAFQLPTDGGFETAAITIEPAGGSTAPTMPIILVGRVAGP